MGKSKDETETRGNHLNDIVDILIQGSQNFDHITKEDLLLPGPARSDSSCSLGRVSVDGARDARDVTRDAREVARDARDSREALCDTSSEVSDEGYKSSQGNVSAKTEPDTADTDKERPGASSEGE